MKDLLHRVTRCFVPIVLITCVLLMALWIVMSRYTDRANDAYDLKTDDFVGYQPELEGWSIYTLTNISGKLVDANIVAFKMIPGSSVTFSQSSLLVRLVHGYNMPMCMKMKYYTVEKLQDHKVMTTSDPKLKSAFTDIGSLPPNNRQQPSDHYSFRIPRDYPMPVQLWRLTSSAGTVGYWVTTMIRSGDFEPTTVDISTMAFPRIDIPDDPHWVPRGLSLDDVKHPGTAFMRWFHSRWDGARWDVLTFLKLRREAQPDNELLSYVTIISPPDSRGERADLNELLEVHASMLQILKTWRSERVDAVKR